MRAPEEFVPLGQIPRIKEKKKNKKIVSNKHGYMCIIHEPYIQSQKLKPHLQAVVRL